MNDSTKGVTWVNTQLEIEIWDAAQVRDTYGEHMVKGSDLLVLLTLNTFADRVTRKCWPSITQIAARSRLDMKTVRTSIARLEQSGLIGIERRDRRSSVIVLTVPTTTEFGTTKNGSTTEFATTENGADYSQKRQQATPENGRQTNISHKRRSSSRENEDEPSSRKRETRLPQSWSPSASHRGKAAELGVDLVEAVEAFRSHAETHDRHAANWNTAFSTWLKKAPRSFWPDAGEWTEGEPKATEVA